MKPKRTHRLPYGQGSFTYIQSKKLWRGRLEAGFDTQGKRVRIEVTARDEDEAWAKLMAKKQDLAAGTLTSSEIERETVAGWAKKWLEMRATQVRPKMFTSDKTAVNKWIVPVLGRKQLRDLELEDVRILAARMREAELVATSINYNQGRFLAMLKDAVLEGYRVPDRVLLAKRVPKSESDREAIPVEDAIKLLRVAAEDKDGSRWVAALLEGVRKGERLGLTWDMVDFENDEVDISWQLQNLPYLDRDAGTFIIPDGYEARQLRLSWHLVRPKTEKGRRIIPMVPWFRNSLWEWKKIAPQSPYGLVWPRQDGNPMSFEEDGEAWDDLQRRAGVVKRPADPNNPDSEPVLYVNHEARDTTATLLLMAGVDALIVKKILGHSKIATTRGYQHVDREMTRAALTTAMADIESQLKV